MHHHKDSSEAASVQEHYPFSRRGELAKGQPIGKLMAQALQYPEILSLAAGFVDNATLPCDFTKECLEQMCSDEGRLRQALQYDSSAGNRVLREAISQWSYQAWPEHTPDPERVIMTAGSNQFLHLLAEAMLNPGDIVIAAAPTYFVFMGTLKGVDARIVGVHADEDGICMDSLEDALEQIKAAGEEHRLKAIYTVTEFDNPAGSTLSLERRERLLDIVERWRSQYGPLMILSDNAYQQLRYDGESIPPISSLHTDSEDFVIELGTLSKSFSPGIRVGWGIVPHNMVERLLEMKSNIDFGSPHFNQLLVLTAIESGRLDAQLPIIRDAYREKLAAMLSALDESMGSMQGVTWRRPHGGLYVWLTLPESIDTAEGSPLWQAALASGVLYVPGHLCFPTEGVGVAHNSIRLSFGVQSCDGIREGIHRLAEAVKGVLSAE